MVVYKNLFELSNKWSVWNQTNITFPCIDMDYLQRLNEQVSDEEVKHAVFLMKPWKAHELDRFPAYFYQNSWNTVGSKVCEHVRQLCMNPSEQGKINHTDICMIPKVVKP